jgi:hypothetical protein
MTKRSSIQKKDKLAPQIIVIPFLILCIGFGVTAAYSQLIFRRLNDDALKRYYAPDIIKRDSLSLTTNSFETRVSNGDILPRHEHEFILHEHWRKVMPVIIVWFVSLFISPCVLLRLFRTFDMS